MNLQKLTDLDISGKKVLLRLDLDVDEDFTRIELAKDTFNVLKEKNCRIIVIGHKGRPDGKIDDKYSLAKLTPVIERFSGMRVEFFKDVLEQQVKDAVKDFPSGKV